ncbi:MAG: YgfZ/GcvT domain-containing protein, partial [Woeseiaceae bacterium]
DIIKVSGSDARSFLQGQLTQDVTRLGNALDAVPSLPAAWCNAKGRVIAVVRMLASDDDGIALVVPAALAEQLVKRFFMYRLRANVDFALAGYDWRALAVTAEDDLAAVAALGLLPQPAGSVARARGLLAVDTGAESRCIEVYGPAAAFRESRLAFSRPLTAVEWRLALIHAGIPLIEAATSEKYTPHMLNLDRLGAVSFSKGCYTGQEVVARTEHLGSSKRRLMHFRTEGAHAAVGDKLRHGERDAGEVVNAVGEELLAVVPVELHGQALEVRGAAAPPVALPYG